MQPLTLLSTRPTEDELRALLEVVVLVAYADGSIAEPEVERIVARVRELSGDSLEREWIEAQIEAARPQKPLLGKARTERLTALRQTLAKAELCRAAFKVGLEVAHADGRIGMREASTLAATAAEFGLDARAVLELLGNVQKE
jgi:tellurite resistance protein